MLLIIKKLLTSLHLRAVFWRILTLTIYLSLVLPFDAAYCSLLHGDTSTLSPSEPRVRVSSTTAAKNNQLKKLFKKFMRSIINICSKSNFIVKKNLYFFKKISVYRMGTFHAE